MSKVDEEVKRLEQLRDFYKQKAKGIERQIRGVKDLKAEASRLRREAKTIQTKIDKLSGPAKATQEQGE